VSELIKISDLKQEHPFSDLFKIKLKTKENITLNMKEFGFDESHPINVWRQTMIVVDGNTRLECAKDAGMDHVYVHSHDFRNEGEALEYAIHNQRDRRNITDSEFLKCVEVLDEVKSRGRPKLTNEDDSVMEKASIDAINLGKSAAKTAETVGGSSSKVERTRAVLKDPKKAAEVASGAKTINKAYTEIREEKATIPKSSSKFNKTNENIEWAQWSWNPVTGCLGPNGKGVCPYCYARDIAMRFQDNFDPAFHPERLAAPSNMKVPNGADTDIGKKNVFVCSMADLFGEWVPEDWITQVINVVKNNTQWNFLFLTKNPSRLVGIDWPDNAWVGTTVDIKARVRPAKIAFRQIKAKVRFLSCEPLREDLEFGDMSMFDWLIIGGQSKSSQEPARQAEWGWVESLMTEARRSNAKVYFKPNLEVRPKEYPARDDDFDVEN